MKVINEDLLDTFRRKPRCEVCKRRFDVLEPHHVWAKGMGGGGRLDVPQNLISVCRYCHQAIHLGKVSRLELLAIVARRERTTVAEIEEEIWRLRRTRA
jgi:hypothetical protein